MKSNKIVYGILASILAFNCISANQAYCMINGDAPTAACSKINEYDASGRTPIIRAIGNEDPSEVQFCLNSGARLDLVYKTTGMNPFETICDFLTWVYSPGEERCLPTGSYRIKKMRECAMIILEHCVRTNTPLHVNTKSFRSYVDPDEANLWDCGLCSLFSKYQSAHPELFSVE